MFTSLGLERFKNFKDAELKLGPFNVLIGANASGKSNIRDAFRFLHGIARGYSLADIIGEKYGEGGERVWSGIRGGIREIVLAGDRSFTLTATFPLQSHALQRTVEAHYRIEVEVDRRRSVVLLAAEELGVRGLYEHFKSGSKQSDNIDINLHASPDFAYKIKEIEKDLRPSVTRFKSPRSAAFLSSFVNEEFPASSWSDEQRDLIFENKYEYIDIMHYLYSERFFDWSADAMRQPSLRGQDVLGDNGRNLSSVLHAICQDKQGKQTLLSWVRELTPMDAVGFEFPVDPSGRILATLVERNKQRITLASASDGTLRFLAFLAAFLGPKTASFYFFEELENGIHPTRLNLLLDLIENQVKTKNIQVVATTHSPQLLGRLSKESLEHASLVYRVPEEPDARIIRVLDMPDAKRLIRKYKAPELFAEGWFEDTAHYMQPDADEDENSKPSRKSRARA